MSNRAMKNEQKFKELKHLLSLELSVDEIAAKMNLSRGYVYKLINNRGWQQFIQPGKRKKEWRSKCELNRLIVGKKTEAETITLIEKYTVALHKELISNGFDVEIEDVRSMANECFAKCMKKFDNTKGASFKTYVYASLRNAVVSYKRKLVSDLRKQGHTEIGKLPAEKAEAA